MYLRAPYETCDKRKLFRHIALTPLVFPMDTALSVSVVGTEYLCRSIIYRQQRNNENLHKTHLNIPAYSSDTWWETVSGFVLLS